LNNYCKAGTYFSTVVWYAYNGMRSQPCYVTAVHSCVMYSTWNPKDNYDISASVFVVQFNVFMSLKFSLILSTDINITETTYSFQF